MEWLTKNPETGDVTVTIATKAGTKDYVLKMSANAAVQLQQRRKMPLGDIVKGFSSMDIESMRDVLFVLLQRHHAAEIKTHEAAGLVLDDLKPTRFFQAFSAVMRESAAEEVGAGANPLEAPTIEASSSTGAASISTLDGQG